jgi:hypothetical protein
MQRARVRNQASAGKEGPHRNRQLLLCPTKPPSPCGRTRLREPSASETHGATGGQSGQLGRRRGRASPASPRSQGQCLPAIQRTWAAIATMVLDRHVGVLCRWEGALVAAWPSSQCAAQQRRSLTAASLLLRAKPDRQAWGAVRGAEATVLMLRFHCDAQAGAIWGLHHVLAAAPVSSCRSKGHKGHRHKPTQHVTAHAPGAPPAAAAAAAPAGAPPNPANKGKQGVGSPRCGGIWPMASNLCSSRGGHARTGRGSGRPFLS